MRSEELRIGNLVIQHNGTCIVVNAELLVYLEKYPNEKFMSNPPIDAISPIPLTKEWLIRLGFESDTITFKNDGICLGWFSGNRFFYLPTWELTYRHKKQIEYVHQLQNLYFALTGEELELK